MSLSEPILVNGRDGWRGHLMNQPQASGQAQVQLEDGRTVLVPVELLSRRDDGTYYLPLGLTELDNASYRQNDPMVIPVIAEELNVQKRMVESGKVRISKVVRERQEVVDEPLLRDEVQVERVAVNQYAATPPSVRYEGETMIIPILEEILVVEKRLLVKEELRVTKRQVTTSQPQQQTLLSEEVIVERTPAQQWQANDGSNYASNR